MALSDAIRKIEESPRSTKVVGVVAVVAIAVVIFLVISRPDQSPEPTHVAAATPTPAAEILSAPTPTPQPTPTSTPVPTATPEPQPTSTPQPTETPLPVATATPEVNDYFVVLHQRFPNDDRGGIEVYASYPFHKDTSGVSFPVYHDKFYLEYLMQEGVITSKQKSDYFNGEPVKIRIVPISIATKKLIENDPYNGAKLRLRSPKYLLHYADTSYLDSGDNAVGGEISLEGGGGYVNIDGGRISVSAVDANGITTTVDFEGVGAEELLDYWLSQNKITVEQVDEYGRTGQIEFSLKDGIDYFDFGVSSDGGGVSFEVDEDVRDLIVNEILPLLVSE